jgi:CheY-like chemotaxis protein
MNEADGSELGVRRRSAARRLERRANRAQQDLEYGAGDPHVVAEVGAKTLGDREHPLPLVTAILATGPGEPMGQNGVFEAREAFLRKPFTPDSLLQALRSLLDADASAERRELAMAV